jgi:hypothetical protein
MHKKNWWRRGFNFFLSLLLLMLLVAGALWVFVASSKTNSTSGANKDLTVTRTDLLPEQARCTSDEFVKNSMPGAALTWSDSVSTPFASSDSIKPLNEILLDQVLAENCGNPTVLAMNIEASSKVPIEDGATIGSVNPWMTEFVSAFNKDDLSFLTKKAGNGDNLYVTPDFQKYAAMTNTVLLRIKVLGVTTEKSSTNWHVAGRSGLAAGEIPRATLNSTEENLPVLKLQYTYKTGQCLFAIGFNIADKRFETLTCTTAPPVKTTTAPPANFVPPATKPPTTTTPPTTCAPTTCLTPKSTNTSDYRQPGDSGKGADVGTGTKPKVTAEPVAQVTPPTVVTTRASAITAPSAKPAPATTTTAPPNQGGGGTGVVTGF